MILELVGLPGSGKTTIAQELISNSKSFYPIRPPHVWSLASIPFFLQNLVEVLWKTRGALPQWDSPRNCIVQSLLLNGWDRRLVKAPSDRVGIIDQGPVFNLGRFEKRWHRTQLSEAWVKARYDRWASAIDCIVYLDGDDNVLVRRVRQRFKPHRLRSMSYDDSLAYIHLHRRRLNRVVERLISNGAGPRVITCQTDQATPSDTVRQLVGVLDGHRQGRSQYPEAASRNLMGTTI